MTPVPQAALPAEFAASPAENAASASGFASGLDAARLRALSPSATATFIRDLCELFKIRVVALVLVTAWGGFYLGCGGFYPGSAESHISILTGGLWCALLGIGLVSAGAGALNEAFEYRTDARMRRTAGRPVAAGRFSLAQGVVAGLGALALGAVWLTLTTNLLTAALAVLTAFTYVAVYTPLKRVTALATFIGAFPGAMGPVLGWTAACGRVEPPALALFAILFVWQFPHLMAIAWLYREDYAHAGIRVLPVVDPSGRSTVAEALSFALLLIPVSLTPWALGLAGATYAVLAVALGLVYLGFSIRFARILRATTEDEGRRLARDLLKASILYLPLLIVALMFCVTAKR